jgi:hypothetical protein
MLLEKQRRAINTSPEYSDDLSQAVSRRMKAEPNGRRIENVTVAVMRGK